MAFIYLQRNYSPLGAHARPPQPSRFKLPIGILIHAIGHALWDIWQKLDGARIVCKVRRPFMLFRYDWHRARTLALDIDDLWLEIRKTQKLFAAIANEVGAPRSGAPVIRLIDTETGKSRVTSKRPMLAGKSPAEVIEMSQRSEPKAETAPKPRRDPDAPFGRDEAGQPIAKYGLRRDGRPRQTPQRVQKRQRVAEIDSQRDRQFPRDPDAPFGRDEFGDEITELGHQRGFRPGMHNSAFRRALRRVAGWLRALPRRRAVRRARLAESVQRHPSGAAA